jgi:hypothetical protein
MTLSLPRKAMKSRRVAKWYEMSRTIKKKHEILHDMGEKLKESVVDW